MENGEYCTSTVYKSLLEAKLIKKLSFWVICTPKSFLKHLKRSKLRHTAGTKKGNSYFITRKSLNDSISCFQKDITLYYSIYNIFFLSLVDSKFKIYTC